MAAARYFAVVPAGGQGSRLGAPQPKQYLRVSGRMLIEWAVAPLLASDWIDRVVVVVAPGDQRAAGLRSLHRRLEVVDAGGATRAATVLGGLTHLSTSARGDDWVLVHDAARPGLSARALLRLRDEVADDAVGGLLALPAADTVKQADDARRVALTLPRDRTWLAQTPQMFRFGMLRTALLAVPSVTDEAGAIEAAGMAPRLVEGERDNFKVTTMDDLEAMQRVLGARTFGEVQS